MAYCSRVLLARASKASASSESWPTSRISLTTTTGACWQVLIVCRTDAKGGAAHDAFAATYGCLSQARSRVGLHRPAGVCGSSHERKRNTCATHACLKTASPPSLSGAWRHGSKKVSVRSQLARKADCSSVLPLRHLVVELCLLLPQLQPHARQLFLSLNVSGRVTFDSFAAGFNRLCK